jgi:DNA polymerase
MTNPSSLNLTLDEIARTLRHLRQAGVSGFDCSPNGLATVEDWGKPKTVRVETLKDIRQDLGDCRRCGLSASRSHIVFGEGSPTARLVFVGEGPGFEEDRSGRPFVGAAGRLLTRIIEAIRLSREDVYICNVIKCRPPSNRNPEPEEIHTCAPFLMRQLAAIRPLLVCALGKFAAQTLLDSALPISKLRGRFYDFEGMRLIPTYHPAFLLRNENRKRDVWEDMKLLMKEYPYED